MGSNSLHNLIEVVDAAKEQTQLRVVVSRYRTLHCTALHAQRRVLLH